VRKKLSKLFRRRAAGNAVEAASEDRLQLFQQSVRRSREFEILTQIGTSLSTSLNSDALLALIHSQLQKLMDVRNFYVAFTDDECRQIRFAFEVEDGDRRAPRVRPWANALTEHIVATGKPLLVTGDVAAYARARGLAPSGRAAKCYLGVPMIIQGKAVGVLAVQSHEQSDAYDSEHLHILEILASQAAAALENARLFAEVERDARQKAFLNHIAKLTISLLSPKEMLATVSEELVRAFRYDHVWLALPRQKTPAAIAAPEGEPEWEVVAAAGLHADGETCGFISLGRGLAGRAALEGEMLTAEGTGIGDWSRCAQSKSGLALPVRLGGEMLGLLTLESHAEGVSSDQLMVLQTLADQIAVALNHATLFQQLQHQAITDSLTGLKTRRFFMEALQAEWRRAEQAGDSFAVILLDLDGFKPLNDTYGHGEGDRVLMRVAQVLEQKCRSSSIVARYGGDEFTILVPACDPQSAQALVERLRAAINQDPVLAGRHLHGSFGLAVHPEHGATVEEMLHFADAGMYAAKQQRRSG
jgi:diguanylate cyclase (GGDEF)-like protein